MTLEEKYQTRRPALQNITFDDASTTNLGLWLEKFLETTHKALDNADRDQKNLINEARAKLIREAHELSLKQAKNKNTATYTSFYQRYEAALSSSGCELLEARAVSRLVVGLGNESLWENSITMHRTYGVPYIPGSALKGLCSSFAHRFLGEAWQKTSEAHRVVFGDTTSSGYVAFFDALPIPGKWALEREVMTVHHANYYAGKVSETTEDISAPTDWDSPNPVPFISASGQFLIAILAPDAWKDAVLEILELALIREGIGAKTSSGFGRLEIINSARKQREAMLAAAAKEQQQQHAELEALKQQFESTRDHQLSGSIDGLVKKLEKLEHNRALARQMLERAKAAKITKGKEDRSWYRTLIRLAEEP
jgi:CRISPR-associated protein Cmr6